MLRENHYARYDDATLERMKRYFKQRDHDEILRYIKTHGVRRHIDNFDDNDLT